METVKIIIKFRKNHRLGTNSYKKYEKIMDLEQR